MQNELIKFKKFVPLLSELVMRDIKVKYRRSVLGVFWTLLNPLLMMAVLSFVFAHLFRFNIDNYALYLLSGQVVFHFFSEATTSAMTAVVQNAALLKKVSLPKYLFPLARIASSTINVLASVGALFLVMLCFHVPLRATLFLAVVPLGLLLVFAIGIGLILARLAVKFLDVVHLYGVVLTVVMYLMPVIYPLALLPDWVRAVVLLNPLTQLLEWFRAVTLYHTIPDLGSMLYVTIWALGILVVGAVVFYREQDYFVLYL